ncbi:glycosyl hydrolase family 28-related protein [Cupriavidus sp. D384]|uniref:glycosyl hydrolase family 28-related protein n=1 Tax=Cupriavidus sp. D384 TaxID=1538095 RepID=UPI000A92CA25|nr:glycosyl hydrolase family 28-related protein [Cupriavidus sp. D384]
MLRLIFLSLLYTIAYTSITQGDVQAAENVTAKPVSQSVADAGISGNAPLPKNLGELHGCANPYALNGGPVNPSGLNWGSGKAVHVDTSKMSQIDNFPTYAGNAVYWTSREAGPGLPVLMNGAFTSNPKTVRLLAVTAGMTDWRRALRASKITVPAKNLASTGIRFTIPPTFPHAVYAVRIEDRSADAVEILINVPQLDWAVGVPSESDPLEAPKHQLRICGADAGGILRLFGKNFPGRPSVILQDAGGSYSRLSVISSDENAIAVSIPASLAAGDYYIWLGNSTQDAASGPASKIRIYANPGVNLSAMHCSGLAGDGATDNAAVMQKCLDANKASSTAANPRYLPLPDGNFVITRAVTLHPHQYIIGRSPSATTITGQSSSPPPAWIQGSHWFGLESLSLKAPMSANLVKGDLTGAPSLSGHLLFNQVNITVSADKTNGKGTIVALSGPDIRVLSSRITGPGRSVDILYGDGALVTDNDYVQAKGSDIGFSAAQNVIFEKNRVQGAGSGMGAGVAFSRPFWKFSYSMICQNLYAGYNQITDIGDPYGQGITTDGGGQAYLGMTSGASAESVTTANDMDFSSVGVTNFQTLAVAISQGRGVGQYRMVRAINGRTITVDRPWDVVPDKTSIISVTSSVFRFVISHNTITNATTVQTGNGFFGNVFDSAILGNAMTNTAISVISKQYDSYFLNLIGIDIINNSVRTGLNTMFPTDPRGSGFYTRNFPGTLISGVYVRGNSIQAGYNFTLANGIAGITSYLVDSNRMTVGESTRQFASGNPAILISNNQAN